MREFIYWHRYAFLVFFRYYRAQSIMERNFLRTFSPDVLQEWEKKIKIATLMERYCEEGMREFALPNENDPIHFSAN